MTQERRWLKLVTNANTGVDHVADKDNNTICGKHGVHVSETRPLGANEFHFHRELAFGKGWSRSICLTCDRFFAS